ncbi:F-box only protein 6-like [Diadema setosum]|uniref:F-box only protein 6-like n=1 Tax=Diadema setosum TaxID=31175 RepID=UPI003B3B7D03
MFRTENRDGRQEGSAPGSQVDEAVESHGVDTDREGTVEGWIDALPFEVLQRILLFVPECNLKECLTVSSVWCKAITEATFWKTKCLYLDRYVVEYVAPYPPDDWREFYFKRPFGRNLIKNCSGQDSRDKRDMASWTVLGNGGDGWLVETKCPGSGTMPEELLSLSNGDPKSFATSYGQCAREQIIDLLAEGFTEEMLDELQPPIFVSEWYAARFDCGNTLEIRVRLLRDRPKVHEVTPRDRRHRRRQRQDELVEQDKSDNEVDCFTFGPLRTEQWADKSWKQTCHWFKDYGPGVRFIQFWDYSKDTQFWAGHYGSKMAGAEVRFMTTEPEEQTS